MNLHLSQPVIRSACFPNGWGTTGHLVVIPARNEADRILACLGALKDQEVDPLVVANNCTDATARLAADAGVAVVDCLQSTGGVGAARRLGVATGIRYARSVRAILTTDADCLVAPDWVESNLRHIHAGAAAVCGHIRPMANEHAALPEALLRRAMLEDRFLDLKAQLELRLTGYAGHEQTPGASLAFTPQGYALSGGFDPVPTHEDRQIILRLKSCGLPVVHARDVVVYASCRFEGRAPGGMASALRNRAADPDAPLCPDMGHSDNPEIQTILASLGSLRTQADLPGAIERMAFLVEEATALT